MAERKEDSRPKEHPWQRFRENSQSSGVGSWKLGEQGDTVRQKAGEVAGHRRGLLESPSVVLST